MGKNISKAVVKRLPRYYRYLGVLEEAGVERISSGELSRQMQVTASQIRQDLNNFGGFGQQGYGYNVRYLRDEIAKILGLDHTNNMIVVGAGHLGQALANYTKFERNSFHVVGIFDVNKDIIGQKIRNIEIMSIDVLPEFLHTHDVEIAALTLPKENAREMAEVLVKNGIHAIWNFAHTDLNLIVPEDVAVQNVHLSESLMRLSYNLKSLREKNMQTSSDVSSMPSEIAEGQE
ncbi:MAG: redox-sensing transcriptional repressor Rex [Bilifractor sp.]|jgi:redox-sensing transcriptional repressor|nr:redox-sensing transcriptional repressor Rex [Lachnospiraceae bacterium]